MSQQHVPAGEPAPAGRPSIAERAAQRDRLGAREDRYSSLVATLQAGRDVPLGRVREAPFEWHPIFWVLVKLAIAGALLYVAGVFAYNWWRDGRVDTWTGPDASVRSGQRLTGCDAANRQHDDTLPTWISFHGSVYILTDRRRPLVGDGLPGQTQLVESGYSQERLRILLPPGHQPGDQPTELVIAAPPADAGRILNPDPACRFTP